MRIKSKRALITGGTSGIGLETARQFLRDGARVAITGRDQAALERAGAELGGGVLPIQSDASDAAAQNERRWRYKKSSERSTVLFVNAGMADLRPIEKWDEAGFDRSFATIVKGPFFPIQALLPVFAKPASIVLNASVNAHIGMPNTSVYGGAKAALASFARTLSGELIGRGIRVNAISPGPISTPLYDKLGLRPEALKTVAASIQSQIPRGDSENPKRSPKWWFSLLPTNPRSWSGATCWWMAAWAISDVGRPFLRALRPSAACSDSECGNEHPPGVPGGTPALPSLV
jgi:NAD(P)-dependent dehydrogenase (short-subunit alcohol dehydrogenase family)